ncbi:MAG: AlpA family phage regulatory protein [Pseudomonadota bacterium]
MRRREVEGMIGLSRSTIYDWMKRGDFPKRVRLDSRLTAWPESDLSEWISQREAA